MKKIIIVCILLLVSSVSWWLLSPLFLNVEVNEERPFSFEEHETIKRNMTDAFITDSMPNIAKENLNKKLGSFVDADASHKVAGDLISFTNKKEHFIRFENFNATNGPDLYVVLSSMQNPIKEGLGKMHILEKLKGNKGNQNYSLKDIKLKEYKSVLIYCKAFSVVFGYASIKK